MPPYLVIWCKEAIPESSKRPFLIGGLLGVWLVEGQDLPLELNDSGYLGNLDKHLQIDDEYAEDLRPYHIPKTDTLRQLMRKGFPDALAISFISNEIFVELPKLPPNEHAKRLTEYSGWFAHDGPKLFYHNGFRITTQLNKQLGQPRRQALEGEMLGSDMLRMDDIYVIDDDETGCRGGMLCKGKTVISQTDQVVRGIFATSDPIAYGDTSIRAGCCGSALVRLGRSREAEGVSEKSGEIGGFLVGSEFGGGDIPNDIPRLLCYAEVNDSFLEDRREGV
ncbi:hypothetical protein V493_05968 [Pseudogymnoascus sp. VKM F-4281 (FW-2241)]|nr:hypothetical protein V493_05968 [Pseudogymnoascus sp. VKM F-4281 (FW-2241)]